MFLGDLMDWLVRDEQKLLFSFLFALVLNLLFLALIALLLWPLGRAAMSLHLALGYAVFWLVAALATLLLGLIQRWLRVDLYTRAHAYIISCAVVSSFVQAGWSAFAALTLRQFVVGAPLWLAVLLYVVGVLSCYVATVVVGFFYEGHIYKFINLPLALLTFLLFSLWPAAGRLLYGWFFNLF